MTEFSTKRQRMSLPQGSRGLQLRRFKDGDRPKVLVVTSPSPREGKTTVISNLAIALAEINHRVLLIDADMRLPRLHTIFDLPNTFGLSDVLHARTPIGAYLDESLVRKASIPDLCLLPAGPARTNLSRLLYSTRMQELMNRFRQTFDTILIDTAPVLSVPDARILARQGYRTIGRWRRFDDTEPGPAAEAR